MESRLGRIISTLVLTALGMAAAGCAQERCEGPVAAVSPTLLFGKEPSAMLATRIGRDPWPATAGRVESVEDTIYLEYYRDNFGGNSWYDNNNPQRQFRSYRIGSQQK